MASDLSSFPVDSWLADMKTAVDRISELGMSILDTHRSASDKAAETADSWRLADRLEQERAALLGLLENVRQIIESIERCRQLMHTDAATSDDVHGAMNQCADAIADRLPEIENAFATIRHSALDLLLWTQRAGRIEGSELPGQYRASYAQLIAYAPISKPLMASLQDELLVLNSQPGLHPDIQRLISSLNRYNAVAESARGFVRSVVEPPLELVFHDTETFANDFQALSADQRGGLATELNDCCQLLLYDPAEFQRRVERTGPRLTEGMDASMVVFTGSDGCKVLFTVDEDPVFEQLAITLLRIVPEDELATATDDLTQALYRHLSSE